MAARELVIGEVMAGGQQVREVLHTVLIGRSTHQL
jgi:hypothetical protein